MNLRNSFILSIITSTVFFASALAQPQNVNVSQSVYSVGEVRYGTYYNGRFGYAIAVPLSQLQPQGLTNGDGQVFAGSEGELRVFGSTTLLEGSLAETYQVFSQSTPGREVTYKVARDNWFVVSGYSGDTVFYTKVMTHPESGAYLSFTLRYDQSLKPTFDPITEEVSRSFRALEGVGSGAAL